MAEIILKYQTQLRGRDDRVYTVQACGRERADQTWEGWLEFTPLDGSHPVISERETTQPNREDLEYWATGLTDPYMDGALLRALTVAKPVPPPPLPESPASDGPAPHVPPPPHVTPAPATSASAPAAVLDPFHVYAEGDEILRGQLHALSASQLRNIVRAYRISDRSAHELERISEPELIGMIMHAAEERAGK